MASPGPDRRAMDKKHPKKKPAVVPAAGADKAEFARVRRRARELAIIDGRAPHDLLESDYEQARRELAGEPVGDEKESLLESLPESARWDPVPGSTGHRAPESSAEDDEDEDGHNESARLVEGGMIDAEDDQATEAEKASGRRATNGG